MTIFSIIFISSMVKLFLVAINTNVSSKKNKNTMNQIEKRMLPTNVTLPTNMKMPFPAINQTNKPNKRKTSVAFVKKMDTTLYGAPAAVIFGFILIIVNLPEQ